MKKAISIIAIALVVGAAVGAYWLFQPHRDVTKSVVDHHLRVDVLVDEYLNDAKSANAKYLAADGDSKIIALQGTISKIRQSSDGRTIVVLKQKEAKAGFQCLFVAEANTTGLSLKSTVTIKGVLRAGPGYDDDLEMFENGYLEECTLVEWIVPRNLESIAEFIDTARMAWWIISAVIILGLLIWRIRIRKKEDFEKRDN